MSDTSSQEDFILGVLSSEMEAVAAALPVDRNNRLFLAARVLGNLMEDQGSPPMLLYRVRADLMEAGRLAELDEWECRRTVEMGLANCMRSIPDRYEASLDA